MASLMSPVQAQERLDADLQSSPDAEAKKLLIKFANLLPALAQGVREHCDLRRLQESQLIRKYDLRLRRAAEVVNNEVTRDGRWDEQTILSEAKEDIESILKKIVDEIKPHSSYQSKFNAAESMLEIFEIVMYQSGDTCRQGLIGRVHYRHWDNLFCELFACFDDEELQILAAHPVARHHRQYTFHRVNYEIASWLDRLQTFVEGAQDYGFVHGVEDMYQTISNAVLGDPIEDESVEEVESVEEEKSLEVYEEEDDDTE
ncbi:hypothetical protein PG996_013969 [Apiospora saccharicola]|uniref:Uncharacterized protein n=1 Tax=Apiospora saccharicola TaxID=335842 RepID=A0ABR1TIZ0_9PEZI